eukprot:2487289-Karenia_brevis.AAC.1
MLARDKRPKTQHSVHRVMAPRRSSCKYQYITIASGMRCVEVIHAMDVLVSHGARAQGEFILKALQHVPDGIMHHQWIALWRRAAATQLTWAVTQCAAEEI